MKLLPILILLLLVPLVGASYEQWYAEPITNDYQYDNSLTGGEGMQQIWDIDWNANDPDYLYFITDTLKMWGSVDGGTTWAYKGNNSFDVFGGTSIVSDPTDETTIIVTAASMLTSGLGNTLGKTGIYISDDSGDTWTQKKHLNFSRIKHGKQILFDDSTTIYVGSIAGLWKSTDSGDAWTLVNNTGGYEVYDLEWANVGHTAIYVATETTLYSFNTATNAATAIGAGLPSLCYDMAVASNYTTLFCGSSNGVYKSNDAGVNFASSSTGLNGGYSYRRLTVSTLNDSIMYASPSQLGGGMPYHSLDAGATWSTISTVNDEQFMVPGYYYAEVMMPSTDVQLEAVGQRDASIAKTVDGGVTITYSGNGYSGIAATDITFIDADTRIICATDYGLFKTDNDGQTYYALTKAAGSTNTCFSADFLANGTGFAAVGTWTSQDIFQTHDFGTTWDEVVDLNKENKLIKILSDECTVITTFQYRDCAGAWHTYDDTDYVIETVDPRNESWLWGLKDGGATVEVGKSDDYFATKTTVGGNISSGSPQTNIGVDPNSVTDRVIVSAAYRLRYSYDDSAWAYPNNVPTGNESTYNSVYYHPTISGTVFATSNGFGAVQGVGVLVSYDHGVNWEVNNDGLGDRINTYMVRHDTFNDVTYVSGVGLYNNVGNQPTTTSCLGVRGIACYGTYCYYNEVLCSESSDARVGGIVCNLAGCT